MVFYLAKSILYRFSGDPLTTRRRQGASRVGAIHSGCAMAGPLSVGRGRACRAGCTCHLQSVVSASLLETTPAQAPPRSLDPRTPRDLGRISVVQVSSGYVILGKPAGVTVVVFILWPRNPAHRRKFGGGMLLFAVCWTWCRSISSTIIFIFNFIQKFFYHVPNHLIPAY